ncbi:hypothetical protein DPMN_034125 [Dreissena polymorpha]|uniref:Uncharacterized protein n=1 Tax=Dreissena polymorpha TaxID=45954 RepID=A0A9D4M710_DREPO|nr:hypothetical protein DPMN_034125 [Dreissena polymorpha]
MHDIFARHTKQHTIFCAIHEATRVNVPRYIAFWVTYTRAIFRGTFSRVASCIAQNILCRFVCLGEEICIPGRGPDDPTTRCRTVDRDREEAHRHRADCTMGDKV